VSAGSGPDGTPAGTDVYDAGSQAEAVEAVLHHGHHPDDPNLGVVRGGLAPGAALAAAIAAAVTLVGVVLLAIAVGSNG
jgi:hypothetical protein